MVITSEEASAAERRMQELMDSTPRAVSARYDRRVARIVVQLNTGLEMAIAPHLVQTLRAAKPAEMAEVSVSPTGLGLYFPQLDVDLYLPALLAGVFGSPSWMAGLMGKKGGASKSEAKRAASQRNGRLGGRPRKVARA
jgi:hypothetical protein